MGRTPLHYASTEAVAKALLQVNTEFLESQPRILAPNPNLESILDPKLLHVPRALHPKAGSLFRIHMPTPVLRTRMAPFFLQAKADPRATDERGGTPLHAVTVPDVAILLLRGKKHGGMADAHVNARDKVHTGCQPNSGAP